MAGDPKQLGPVLRSKIAEKKGLGELLRFSCATGQASFIPSVTGVTLLERLMSSCELFSRGADGTYDKYLFSLSLFHETNIPMAMRNTSVAT